MRNRSILTKLVLFGGILSIFPAIFVGGFSYFQSSRQVQQEVNKSKLDYVKQLDSNVEQIFLTVNHTLTNLAESTVMEQALKSKMTEYDFILYNNLRKQIGFLQSFDTKVEDVIILNQDQNWLIKNSGLYRLNQHVDENKYLSYFNLKNDSTWTLLRNADFHDSISASRCPYTISLVRKLPVRGAHKSGLAFANIPACSISAMIDSSQDADQVLIVDRQFHIVAAPDSGMLGQSLLDTGYVADPGLFENAAGQFKIRKNNRPYTITYVKSSLNNWIYLTITSIDQLTQQSDQIGLFTLYISLAIILLSFLFVWITTRRLYSPLHKVVDFIREKMPESDGGRKDEIVLIEEQLKRLFSSKSRMEGELRDHNGQVRYLFLQRLFSGQLKTNEIEARQEYLKPLHPVERWKNLFVLALQVDTLDDTHYDTQDVDLLRFAMANIAEETMPRGQSAAPIWIAGTLVVLAGFGGDHGDARMQGVFRTAESIQQNIEKYLRLSVSIGISLPFRQIGMASRAYLEAIEALKHRIKLGKSVIIPFSNANVSGQSLLYQYPLQTENDFLDSVQTADRDEALSLLNVWMNKVFERVQTPYECQIVLMQLLNRMLVIKQEAGISFEQIGVLHGSLYEELLALQLREDVEAWFKTRIVLPLLQVFADRRDSQFHSLSEQMIDMIRNGYDTNITLEDCAAKLHYNANYLSGVFKNETGSTFSDYLANYRFNISKKWLAETDMTVKEISDKLQYTNPQNFIRSFRRRENVTPGQFRDKAVR